MVQIIKWSFCYRLAWVWGGFLSNTQFQCAWYIFFALASLCAAWNDCSWLLYGIHSYHPEDLSQTLWLRCDFCETLWFLLPEICFICCLYIQLQKKFCLNIHQRDLCHWWLMGLFCTAWKEETGQFPSLRVLFSDHKFHQISTPLLSWLWKCLTPTEATYRKSCVNLYNWDLSICFLSVTLLNTLY